VKVGEGERSNDKLGANEIMERGELDKAKDENCWGRRYERNYFP
jgi:hypothetical protein